MNFVGFFISNMSKRFFIALLFLMPLAHAQKVVEKTVVHPGIFFIGINADNCFAISLETNDTNELTVEAKIEGEYTNDLIVSVKEEGSAILISAGFQPGFEDPNDKLSAHKVVSIALRILMPRYKRVALYGTNCNVSATGDYENLNIKLGDGSCHLHNVSETVEVVTLNGDISVIGTEAHIVAKSKYGNVQENPIVFGNNNYTLTTTNGNISLRNTE
tara:strand:+ start:13522 stop:14172 length:651 start_codon:yes stop_codon:yes gene_type:complete